MSKTMQRKVSARNEKYKRFLHGAKQARAQHNMDKDKSFSYTLEWYPKCMAWRAGFLKNGGKKFW